MDYVYCWRMRPSETLEVELRVRASTARVARRELTRFVATQGAGDWTIREVSRAREGEPSVPAQRLLALGEPSERERRAEHRSEDDRAAQRAWERSWQRS
jgi:hypothetical protein